MGKPSIMPLAKEQKKEVVNQLKESLKEQNVLIFANFLGLDVFSISQLRKELRNVGAKIMVVKKTLAQLAFKDLKIDLPEEAMEGEMALIFGFEEQIPAAKATYKFAKENEALKLKVAYLREGDNLAFMNNQELIAFAELPSKEELYSRLVGTIKAPISNFVNVQRQNIKGLFYALGAIVEKSN